MNNFKSIWLPLYHAVVSGLLVASLAACNPSASGEQFAANDEAPLTGAKIGGSFTLTNQDGGKTSDTEFAGKYRIIYFGYSFCPDVCPVDLQKLMQGFRLLEKQSPEIADKIQPIFITIDPERDQPEQLTQYVSAFHPRLIGLTGSAEEIAAVAKKYLIIYDKREQEDGSAYLMNHSRQAYLFGPEGEPLALLPYDGSPQDIAAEINRWAK